MRKYKLALETGGLMECPEFDIQFIHTVKAKNIREAKQKWAEETGHDDPKYWDKKNQTFWGWQVVKVTSVNKWKRC